MSQTNYEHVFRVDGKAALVTGAASGLGAESARALAKSGAKVLVADINSRQGEETTWEINNNGGEAAFFNLNVTDEAQWQKAIETAVQSFGRLDILVNNAGVEQLKLISDTTLAEFRHIVEVNLMGTFLGLKHAISAMSPGGAAGHGGSIINISSGAGIVGIVGMGAYCAAKGAVRLLTKSAAVECGHFKKGVRVNSIHPGLICTNMSKQFLHHFVELGWMPDDGAAEAASIAMHPIGYLGEPRDVASAVLYLASDASRFVTGAELAVDGGYTAI